MTSIDRRHPTWDFDANPATITVPATVTNVPARKKPLPPMVAAMRATTAVCVLAWWTVCAWTFGLLQGGDVLNPAHNGLDYHDRVQIAVRNYGWVSAFQGVGMLGLMVGGLVVVYFAVRRCHATDGVSR